MLGRTFNSPNTTKAVKRATGFILAAFVVFGLFVGAASAQTTSGLSVGETGIQYGAYTGLTGTDIRVTIANIIRIALGFLGILAVLLILYGGFTWMTAGGSDERVQRAKQIITSAVIGLVILILAFAIVSFIMGRLLGVVSDAGPGGPGGSGPDDTACLGLSATCPTGALGNGIIDVHYPGRNATGIPRNTRIVVTFKDAIDPATLILDGDAATIGVVTSAGVGSSPQFISKFADRLTSADLDIAVTADNKTLALIQRNCPTDCFGSPSENVFYTVGLRGGTDGIRKADGSAAFMGTLNSGYLWEFQVSTTLDLTPPAVTFVTPLPDSRENPRNSLVQVNFNEAIDPLSVASGISVTQSGGTIIPGESDIGNAYRSIEFRSNDLCGTNSCGEQIFCLPGNTRVTTDVRAAALVGDGPTGVFPPNGITDMAGNSLDGNGDGAASGPPDDTFQFAFETNDTIDLTPPVIVDQDPQTLEGNIARDLRVSATFSKLMSTTSFTTESMQLSSGQGGPPTNFMVVTEHQSVTQDADPTQTEARFLHDLFSTNQPYSAFFTSAIRDTRQNCFFPGAGQSVCTGSEPFCCNGIPSAVECGFLQ